MIVWNPWHGCHKKSDGCLNCYMFARDATFGKNSNKIEKTKDYNLVVRKKRNGSYYVPIDENVYVCLTSDFFIEEADAWREYIWRCIRYRSDLHFYIITKRIERFKECILDNYGDGYDNLTIMCTIENQKVADERLPIFLDLPIKHREIVCEPMLEKIDIDKYLKSGLIEKVSVGGESGDKARLCDYDWILNMREQCINNKVSFYFKQTGAKFKKGNKIYNVARYNQMTQAEKANIDVDFK